MTDPAPLMRLDVGLQPVPVPRALDLPADMALCLGISPPNSALTNQVLRVDSDLLRNALHDCARTIHARLLALGKFQWRAADGSWCEAPYTEACGYRPMVLFAHHNDYDDDDDDDDEEEEEEEQEEDEADNENENEKENEKEKWDAGASDGCIHLRFCHAFETAADMQRSPLPYLDALPVADDMWIRAMFAAKTRNRGNNNLESFCVVDDNDNRPYTECVLSAFDTVRRRVTMAMLDGQWVDVDDDAYLDAAWMHLLMPLLKEW